MPAQECAGRNRVRGCKSLTRFPMSESPWGVFFERCANLALHKNLYAAFAARASKVYRAPKPSLGGRGTAASAVVDEGRFLTFTTGFPHPSALRAATFSREKVLGCCKRQYDKHQLLFYASRMEPHKSAILQDIVDLSAILLKAACQKERFLLY